MVTVLLAAAFLQQGPAAVTLSHAMKVGDKVSGRVKGHLVTETRQPGLDTWLPDETWLQYDYYLEVTKEKADGIVDAKYRRPTFSTTVPAEGGENKTTVEKVNMTADVTISPINEILAVKDTTPKKAGSNIRRALLLRGVHGKSLDMIGDVLGDIYRLSMFIGSLDSSLDFQPKLPFDEVKEGDTWKRTVSYSPQALDSKGGKSVMQRLDMVYTYKGIVDSDGKKAYRVNGSLDVNADMMKYMKDNFGPDAQEILAQIKEISYRLNASINYDLDMKTCSVLKASSLAKGDLRLVGTQVQEALMEQKITAETSLKPIPKS